VALRTGVFLAVFSLFAFVFGQPAPRAILPGDRLQMISSNCDLCVSARVAEDGKLSLEGLGPISVATLDLQTAAQKICIAMQRANLAVPDLKLELIAERGAPVGISGAVAHPLQLRCATSIALDWALAQAGPLDEADMENVGVVRPDGFARRVASTDEVRLHGGEQAFVSMSSGSTDVIVAGGVAAPLSIRFKKGMTVAQAIDLAGGIAPVGNPNEIVLVRHGEPMPLAWPEDGGILVKPGELVRVSLRAERLYVIVYGDVVHPGLVDFVPGMTATQAIKAAGGSTGNVLKELVNVRTILSQKKKPPKLNLGFMQALRIPDPVLAPDQIVEVSKQ
jgi:protein involved in polysaccharide export with SLBB domain